MGEVKRRKEGEQTGTNLHPFRYAERLFGEVRDGRNFRMAGEDDRKRLKGEPREKLAVAAKAMVPRRYFNTILAPLDPCREEMERMSLAYDITLSNTLTDLYRRYADKTGRNDPFRHARIRRFPGGWSAREKISRAIGPHVDKDDIVEGFGRCIGCVKGYDSKTVTVRERQTCTFLRGMILHNDHSPRIGTRPANTRKHVFKISRARQNVESTAISRSYRVPTFSNACINFDLPATVILYVMHTLLSIMVRILWNFKCPFFSENLPPMV
ncbi:hypothetical protein EAG_09745 [Camponotus floridanus]|uniref:Uncharacterized protein n=1 Tax=Camponotus floridanus TaxID=104421 RepID=E1ZVQ2_CAMFO|nr:hypothetical protein EAG_09745 [Camponotus floridanus]